MASKFKLNLKGFVELRSSPKVQAELRRRANAIAAAAGPGHEVDHEVTKGLKGRARFSVRTATTAAVLSQSKHQTLSRAIDAGRH